MPNSIWPTYSAFANTIGGVIILGIEKVIETDNLFPRYEIRGVKNVDKQIKEFWNTINSETVNANILSDDNVYALDLEQGSIIIIEVPQADYRYKPELSQDQDGTKSGLSWDQVGTKSGLRWDQAKKVLQLCMTERTLLEIMGEMQLTSRNKFRKNFVIPLLNLHLLERTVPDKPNSRNQKYRITSKGKEMLSQG